MRHLRAIRLLVEHQGSLRRLCTLAFPRKDASIYLFPFAAQNKYYYGRHSVGENQAKLSFDFTHQMLMRHIPKLSIHETGQIHIRHGGVGVEPLFIPPLSRLRGQHVATVSADGFSGLPRFDGIPNDSAGNIHYIIPAQQGVESGRLALYINGSQLSFASDRVSLSIRLERLCLSNCLYIGLAPIAQFPLGSEERRGVTVLAGFDPTKPPSSEVDFLYVRGE